jgi:hypothetical protein
VFEVVTTTTPTLVAGKFQGISCQGLANEPNLTACSMAGISACGGPITHTVLAAIQRLFGEKIENAKKNHNLEPVFNVWISPMLVKQYPDIPGWHCDGVPYDNYTGQPSFRMVNPAAFNVALTLSSELMGVATHEYVGDLIKMKIWDQQHVFKDLHREVTRIAPRIITPTDGQFVLYTPATMVRARPCTRRGYHYHLRMSMYEKPPIQNKIGGVRTVYQLGEENGW